MLKMHAVWHGKKFSKTQYGDTFCGRVTARKRAWVYEDVNCLKCLKNVHRWITDPKYQPHGSGWESHIALGRVPSLEKRIHDLKFNQQFKKILK